MSTLSFSTEDITSSINNYLNIITDSSQLLTTFAQGNCFEYDPSQLSSATTHVHAYPGIFEGALYFFMIPAQYDNKVAKLDGSMAENTQGCLVVDSSEAVSTHRIPDYVAQARINDWIDYHVQWIPDQIPTENGMFKAFEISVQDFEELDDAVFLGLEIDKDAPGGFRADLIVANPDKTSQVVVFDDFVQAVPPYSSTAQQESFYLLG